MTFLLADRCDHCQRDFSREPVASPVICPSCGVENVRAVGNEIPVRENTSTAPAQEKAVLPRAQARPSSPQKKNRKR